MTLHIPYQRAEAVASFALVTYLYISAGYGWVWFVVFLLAVDISMAGYIVNTRVGAHVYNLGHILVLPILLLITGHFLHLDLATAAALIWMAHISLDRSLGYGLKAETGFQDTHLGKIGKR